MGGNHRKTYPGWQQQGSTQGNAFNNNRAAAPSSMQAERFGGPGMNQNAFTRQSTQPFGYSQGTSYHSQRVSVQSETANAFSGNAFSGLGNAPAPPSRSMPFNGFSNSAKAQTNTFHQASAQQHNAFSGGSNAFRGSSGQAVAPFNAPNTSLMSNAFSRPHQSGFPPSINAFAALDQQAGTRSTFNAFGPTGQAAMSTGWPSQSAPYSHGSSFGSSAPASQNKFSNMQPQAQGFQHAPMGNAFENMNSFGATNGFSNTSTLQNAQVHSLNMDFEQHQESKPMTEEERAAWAAPRFQRVNSRRPTSIDGRPLKVTMG